MTRLLRAGRYGGVVLLLAVIVMANLLLTPNFRRVDIVWSMFLQSFPVIIMSLGMAMVVASGGIDLSVGSCMALASILFAKLSLFEGWSPLSAAGVALAAAVFMGVVNGLLIGRFALPALAVTLGTMLIGRGVTAAINEGKTITFYDSALVRLGLHRFFGIVPVHAVIIAATVAVVFLLVRKTVFGIYLQAVGDNAAAARSVGIRTGGIILAVYAAASFLAGIAALFETARLASSDPVSYGAQTGLDCIAAVALGGTPLGGGRARVIGTVVGAMTMQAVTTTVIMNNLPNAYALVLKALIIVLALSPRKGA